MTDPNSAYFFYNFKIIRISCGWGGQGDDGKRPWKCHKEPDSYEEEEVLVPTYILPTLGTYRYLVAEKKKLYICTYILLSGSTG